VDQGFLFQLRWEIIKNIEAPLPSFFLRDKVLFDSGLAVVEPV